MMKKTLKVGVVGFFWTPNPETGKWIIRKTKVEIVEFAQTAYPDDKLAMAEMFNHMEDVRNFHSVATHQGLIKAIEHFFIYAQEKGWTSWLFI